MVKLGKFQEPTLILYRQHTSLLIFMNLFDPGISEMLKLLLQASSPHTTCKRSHLKPPGNPDATYCFTFVLQMRKLGAKLCELDAILMVEPGYTVGQRHFRIYYCDYYTVQILQ